MNTIARFQVPEEAHLFRAFLEAQGIAAHVWDEHFVQVAWYYSDAIGGVRVVTDGGDFEPALESYQEYARALREPPVLVTVARGWLLVLVLSFFVGAPMLIFGRRAVGTQAAASD